MPYQMLMKVVSYFTQCVYFLFFFLPEIFPFVLVTRLESTISRLTLIEIDYFKRNRVYAIRVWHAYSVQHSTLPHVFPFCTETMENWEWWMANGKWRHPFHFSFQASNITCLWAIGDRSGNSLTPSSFPRSIIYSIDIEILWYFNMRLGWCMKRSISFEWVSYTVRSE